MADGSEQPMDSLSLIDAVMPDVVASRQQQMQNNQKPQVVKTEPPNSNGDEPMHSYPNSNEGQEEETGVEIPASKSTVLRGNESEVFICAWNPTWRMTAETYEFSAPRASYCWPLDYMKGPTVSIFPKSDTKDPPKLLKFEKT
ncbi:hypothetical protein DAPPUDRAFT_257336 [Daphnia pulex]|uniref:Uncharacterized protein n=1 Tax=Daphnia pulex TaxID=6669 RepID=E9HDD2_DAPPU|nr:hypothetical protein DAPPUDRAFT_257336 [Daphnia pulex]|eukprot:EFX70265.1 hypothetical protein DAPPUDRAFT_257336 [Daphnia pulex]